MTTVLLEAYVPRLSLTSINAADGDDDGGGDGKKKDAGEGGGVDDEQGAMSSFLFLVQVVVSESC